MSMFILGKISDSYQHYALIRINFRYSKLKHFIAKVYPNEIINELTFRRFTLNYKILVEIKDSFN